MYQLLSFCLFPLCSLKFLKVINTSLTYKHAFYWNLLIITIEGKHVQCFFLEISRPSKICRRTILFLLLMQSLSYYITYFYYFLIIFDHNGICHKWCEKFSLFLLISISSSSIYSKKNPQLIRALFTIIHIVIFIHKSNWTSLK